MNGRLCGIMQFTDTLLGEQFPSRVRLVGKTLAQLCELCDEVILLDDGWSKDARMEIHHYPVSVLSKRELCKERGLPYPYFHEALNLNHLAYTAYNAGATHVLRIDGDETFADMDAMKEFLKVCGIGYESARFRIQKWLQTRLFPSHCMYEEHKRTQFGEPIGPLGLTAVCPVELLHHGYEDCEPEYRVAKHRMWTTLETMKHLDGSFENGMKRNYDHILDPEFAE